MDKYKRLASNTLLLSIGTFSSKLLVFFMVRFYTGYLTPSDYGTADLITQSANLFMPLVSLGMMEGVFRFAADVKEQDKRSVFTAGILSVIVGSSIFLLLIPLLRLGHRSDDIWLVAAYTVASCYHAICAHYVRGLGNTKLFAAQGIVNTALVIGLNILFLAHFQLGLWGYVMSVVIANCFGTGLIVLCARLWRHLTIHPQGKVFGKMLSYSIPLIPTAIFWWIMGVSDRYMVRAFLGGEANGIYAVAYKIPTILAIISTIFMESWQFSAVSEDYRSQQIQRQFYSRIWSVLMAVMFLSASAITAFAKPAIRLLATEQFHSAWRYIPMLAFGMVFSSFSGFMGSVYVVKKKSSMSFCTSLAGAMFNVAANLLLIPSPLGIQGAAVATAGSCVLVFLLRLQNARKYIPFPFDGNRLAVNTLILLIQVLWTILELSGWWLIQGGAVLMLLCVNQSVLKQGTLKFKELFLQTRDTYDD